MQLVEHFLLLGIILPEGLKLKLLKPLVGGMGRRRHPGRPIVAIQPQGNPRNRAWLFHGFRGQLHHPRQALNVLRPHDDQIFPIGDHGDVVALDLKMANRVLYQQARGIVIVARGRKIDPFAVTWADELCHAATASSPSPLPKPRRTSRPKHRGCLARSTAWTRADRRRCRCRNARPRPHTAN